MKAKVFSQGVLFTGLIALQSVPSPQAPLDTNVLLNLYNFPLRWRLLDNYLQHSMHWCTRDCRRPVTDFWKQFLSQITNKLLSKYLSAFLSCKLHFKIVWDFERMSSRLQFWEEPCAITFLNCVVHKAHFSLIQFTLKQKWQTWTDYSYLEFLHR